MFIVLFGKEADSRISHNVAYTGPFNGVQEVVTKHLGSCQVYYHPMVIRGGKAILFKKRMKDKRYLSLGEPIEVEFVKASSMEDILNRYGDDPEVCLSLTKQFLTIMSDKADIDFTIEKALRVSDGEFKLTYLQSLERDKDLYDRMETDPKWVTLLQGLGTFGEILKLTRNFDGLTLDYPNGKFLFEKSDREIDFVSFEDRIWLLRNRGFLNSMNEGNKEQSMSIESIPDFIVFCKSLMETP